MDPVAGRLGGRPGTDQSTGLETGTGGGERDHDPEQAGGGERVQAYYDPADPYAHLRQPTGAKHTKVVTKIGAGELTPAYEFWLQGGVRSKKDLIREIKFLASYADRLEVSLMIAVDKLEHKDKDL